MINMYPSMKLQIMKVSFVDNLLINVIVNTIFIYSQCKLLLTQKICRKNLYFVLKNVLMHYWPLTE